MLDICKKLVNEALCQGADAADCIASATEGISADIYEGQVDSFQKSQTQGVGLRAVSYTHLDVYKRQPIIYAVLLIGVTYTESFIFVNTGYKMGTEAALSILEGGAINKFISCASVLGMFMMGGLSASMVSVYTTAQIPTGENTVMTIQGDILDAVAPGLLTLAAVLLVYKYLRSGHSMMKATFWLLGIGLVLGAVGVIGDGGFLIKPLVEAAA